MESIIDDTFEIIIRGTEPSYQVQATGPDGSLVWTTLPSTIQWLNNDLQETLAEMAAENSQSRGDEIRMVGEALYKALFTDDIKVAFAEARGNVPDKKLRLRLLVEPPELAVLPWETMHDGTDWLAMRSKSPLVRRFPTPGGQSLKPLPVQPPLRLLFVGALPTELDKTLQDADKELVKALGQLLKEQKVQLYRMLNPTFDELQEELAHDYHILLFLGHGSAADPARSNNPSACIYLDGTSDPDLEDHPFIQNGQEQRGAREKLNEAACVSAVNLAKALEGKPTRMVFLSACYTAAAASDKGGFLESFAQVLSQKVPAIVAMQYFIGVDKGAQLTASFLRSLDALRPIDVAFVEARNALFDAPDLVTRDYFSPVMYLQYPELNGISGSFPVDVLSAVRVPPSLPNPPNTRWNNTIIAAIILGIATVIAAIAPSAIGFLWETPAISEAAPISVTTPTITLSPALTPSPSIQSIVRKPSLSSADVEVLREYLAGSAPEEEKWDVILALGKPQWTNVVLILQDVISNSRDTTTKQNAVLSLRKIGPSAQSALLWALDYDPNDSILRANVINALGELPDERNLAVFKIQSILRKTSEVPVVARVAVEALGKLNAVSAVNDIIRVLRTHEQIVRTQAAQTLSRFDLPQVKAALRRVVIEEPVVDTRLTAINSLITLGDKEAVSLFIQLQEGDEPDAIHNAAREAIYRLSSQVPGETDTDIAVEPTLTVKETVSGLSLLKGMKGFSQGELVVQLADGLSETSATYDAGTRVQFVLAAPDKAELALVELPDGRQGWIAVSSVEWSANNADAFPNFLWPNGKVIKIAFLDGDEELQKKVEQYAQEWTKYANLTFDFGEHEDAEVRVSFEQPGSWSYIGATALDIPEGKPTINMGWLRSNTSEEEIKRVVLHEFGHTVGLLHEMLNPNNTVPWDKKAVYEFYTGSSNHWTKEAVDRNFFEFWAPGTYPAEKEFDRNSIMMFPVSNELTYGDYEIGWNRELSEGDRAFAAMLYPRPPTVTGNDAGIHYTWFGNISPSVVGIAGSAAEANSGNEILMNGEMFGVFSGIFLPLLRDEQADLNGDGYVSLDEAVLVTGVNLKKRNFQQSPLIVGEDKDFSLFSLQPNAPTPSRPRRLEVLLIGINEYAFPNPPLRGPVNDVKLLEKLLKEEEYVAADEVKVTLLTDQEASAENLRTALGKLVEDADSSTAIVFYFSGHNGVKTSQESPNVREKAIVPADATDAQKFIGVAEISALLAQSRAKYKILIIDG